MSLARTRFHMSERNDNSPGRGLLRRPASRGLASGVADLVRAQFGLGADWVVSVSELRCTTPGCPPVETVALMWDAGAVPHRLRLFKPLAQVRADDLPPRWYLPALVVDADGDGACC